MISKAQIKDLVYQTNGAAIEVHKILGPGLLESVYHKCLTHELKLRQIKFQSEMVIPIEYKGLEFDTSLKADLLIENCLLVELKSVSEVLPLHETQLLTYMKLLKASIGLMINFNVTHIFNEGQKTYVNELYRYL